MADTMVSTLPRYVEFGFRSSYPGPFNCRKGDMRMLVLDGDGDRIARLVRRTLTEPAGGTIEYRPLGSRVILLYGYNLVSSAIPPWDRYGAVEETLASFWVPVWAGRPRGGEFEAERLGMTVPYILVDNPMSHMAGREIYGFAKAAGRFIGSGDRLEIHGYGGNFDPDEIASWRPLLEIAPAPGARQGAGRELDGTSELVRELGAQLIDGVGPEDVFDVPRVRLVRDLCELALNGRFHQVFLKQFRDAVDHSAACYQKVVEGPARIRSVRPRLSLHDWDVAVHGLASHPISEELGVETQRVSWSVEVRDFEFDVLAGQVIGP